MAQDNAQEPDFIVEDHGSLYVFQPMSETAREWTDENIDIPSWAWIGGGFAVAHSLASDLASGILDAGMALA